MMNKGGSGSYDKDVSRQSFSQAFAEARGRDAKTFEWRGKKYTTDMAKPKAAANAEPTAPKVDAVSRHKKLKEEMAAFEPGARTTPGPITRAMSRDGMSSVPAMAKSRMASGKITSMEDEQPEGYAKGGSVSGRADGIASKGKTNCKMR